MPPDEPAAFCAWLERFQRGAVADETTMAMAEVAAAARALGKKGTVTLKLTIEAKGSGRTVLVTAEVTSAVPQPAPEPSVFFVDDEGRLSRSDPFQLRLADRDTGEIVAGEEE